MILFPFHKYQLETNLTPTEVSEKLSKNIDFGHVVSGRGYGDIHFEGFANHREFEINNRRSGSDELTPYVSNLGEIEETESGSIIYIRAYLSVTYYLLFIGFPLVIVGIGIYQAFTSSPNDGKNPVIAVLFGIGLYILGLFAYIYHLNEGKVFFIRILNAKIIN